MSLRKNQINFESKTNEKIESNRYWILNNFYALVRWGKLTFRVDNSLNFCFHEKATKIWKNLPLVLTLLRKNSSFVKTSGRFFFNFMAFLQCLNFTFQHISSLFLISFKLKASIILSFMYASPRTLAQWPFDPHKMLLWGHGSIWFLSSFRYTFMYYFSYELGLFLAFF